MEKAYPSRVTKATPYTSLVDKLVRYRWICVFAADLRGLKPETDPVAFLNLVDHVVLADSFPGQVVQFCNGKNFVQDIFHPGIAGPDSLSDRHGGYGAIL